MQLIYQPDGKPAQTFDFRPRKLPSEEAEAIERVTGMTFGEFGVAFLKGSMLAYRAALWVLLRRSDSSLRFQTLSIVADDLQVRFDPDEVDALKEGLRRQRDLDADQRANLEEMLTAQGVDQPDDGGEAPPFQTSAPTPPAGP